MNAEEPSLLPVGPPLLLAFRWITLTWMVLVAFLGADVQRPATAVTTIAVALGWTTWLTLAAPPHGWAVLVVDLAQAGGVVVVSGLIVPQGQLVAGHAFVAGAYPMGAAAAWAVRHRVAGGLSAGVALALSLAGACVVDGVPPVEMSYVQLLQLLTRALAYVLVGVTVGLAVTQLDRLTVLARRMSDQAAGLRERQRLAGIIHDDVIQQLARIRRDVGSVADDPTAVHFLRITEDIRRQESALRHIAVFVPAERSDRVALSAALSSMIDSIDGVPVRLITSGPIWLAEDRAADVVAAVQEALLNVVKHAKARHAWVTAYVDAGQVTVCVRDDGRGFVLDEAGFVRQGRLGIAVSIVARTAGIGGQVTIDSGPRRGTEVTLRVPPSAGIEP